MTKTTDKTVAKFIEHLFSLVIENRDPDLADVRGAMDGSEANIVHVCISDAAKAYPAVTLELSDGTRFAIRVQQLQSN